MPSSSRIPFAAFAVVLAILASGCAKEKSDEQQIREILATMEQHMESGDVGEFMKHVSGDYLDPRSNRKQEVRNLARLHILRNRTRHLFQQVSQIQISGDRHAEAVVLVAMAGQPIGSSDSLKNIRADLMRFQLRFVFDDRWRVISAEWSRAGIGDFL